MFCSNLRRILRPALPALLAVLMLGAFGCAALDEGIDELAGGDNPYQEYYDKGVEAYNNGDYYAARDYFLSVEDYGNSKEFLAAIDEYERVYLEGVEQFNAKNYDAALLSFTAVGKFSNAEEYVEHINELKAFYEEGLRLYGEQDFVAAKERFVQSCEYGSSADYIASIDAMEEKYQAAMGLYEAHKYRSAIAAFEAIGANYKDTYDMISAIYGILEHGGVMITQYLADYKTSHSEQGDPVEYELTDINEKGFMITDSKGILIIGNTKDDSTITEISFWMGEEMLEGLTDEEVNGLLAHCIRALDLEMMTYDEVLANMDEYTGGRATYGNFSFELNMDDAGYAVLKAVNQG